MGLSYITKEIGLIEKQIKLKHFETLLQEFVQSVNTQDSAHDVKHIRRVVKTAKLLCQQEGAIAEVVVPAAYLHDCFSYPKDHSKRAMSSQRAAEKALDFLQSIGYPELYFEAISHAIVSHSYSANVTPQTLEAKIVQDADRLDALGAIGIARCIQVSSSFGAQLYSSDDPFCHLRQPRDKQFAVDHFYSKLFKLIETMNTEAARIEAKARTAFMKQYLAQLESEI